MFDERRNRIEKGNLKIRQLRGFEVLLSVVVILNIILVVESMTMKVWLWNYVCMTICVCNPPSSPSGFLRPIASSQEPSAGRKVRISYSQCDRHRGSLSTNCWTWPETYMKKHTDTLTHTHRHALKARNNSQKEKEKRKKEDQEDKTIEHRSKRLTNICVNELHVVSCWYLCGCGKWLECFFL